MKNQEEMRKELNRLYCATADQKGVSSWTEFAAFVGIPYPTIYRYVNQKSNMTESMYRRICNELLIKGVVIEDAPISPVIQNAQNVNAPVNQTTTDAKWFDLVAEKDVQISRLLGIIENMQK